MPTPRSLLLPTALALLAPLATASEIVVAGSTIQGAVDVAAPGDTIVVPNSVYRENVVVTTDDLTFKGKQAVIDGQFQGPCFTILADGITLTGFVLIDGGDPDGVSASLRLEGDDAMIGKTTVLAGAGTGLDVSGTNARIVQNTIRGCLGDAIRYASGATDSLSDLEKNRVAHCAGGIVAQGGQLNVNGNRLEALQGPGLDLDPSVDANITSVATRVMQNRVTLVEGTGIEVDVTTGGKVIAAGNRVTSAGGAGIDVSASGDGIVNVTDSRVTGAREDALRVVSKVAFFVARCTVRDAGGDGLRATANSDKGGTLERNTIRDVAGDGIEADGQMLEIRQNQVTGAVGRGLVVQGIEPTIRRNRIKDCAAQGLVVDGTDGLIEDDVVLRCALDGLLLSGSNNTVTGCVFARNGGDGIDLQPLDGLIGDNGNALTGNTCTANAHEGIDNSALDTVIDDNTVLGNGGEPGPEVAGAGNDVDGDDLPDGTVASFAGNTLPQAGGPHDPGGATTPQRLDLGEAAP